MIEVLFNTYGLDHYYTEFFVNIPIYCVEKDFALKLGGHRESWVVIFGGAPALEGQNGGYPLKKIIFFPVIFCQRIDRKSQEISATLSR